MKRRSFLTAIPVAAAQPPPDPHAASPTPTATLTGTFVDLSTAQPSAALSPIPKKRHWRTVTYELKNGQDNLLKGTLLFAGPETDAPILTIDPKLKGPHELFIGLPNAIVYANRNQIRIKLDSDPCFTPLSIDADTPSRGVQDCRFRAVDMTGRRIQIATSDLLAVRAAAVAYIRAVPIPESQLDSRQPKGMRMITLNDGFSYLWERGVSTEDRLWEEIYLYKDSPYHALQFCITGADHCNYPTKIGTLIGDSLEDYPRVGDRYYTECVRNYLRKGIDPVASTMKLTRSIGLEYHLSIRMEAFAADPLFDGMFMSKFYAANPQFSCKDLDGREITRMSYAFREVREHIFAIIDEMAAYHPEGINLIFPRANPYLLYEEPFLHEFRLRHGSDARKLPEFHPDVLAVRCDVMTDFMRQLRQRVNAKRGKRIELSAIVLADRESNRNFGLDIERWVEEGLVDEISPSVWNGAHRQVDPQMRYLVDVCRRKRCRLIANMLPRHYKPSEYLTKARQYLADGAEGFSMWDLNGHHNKPHEWALLKFVSELKQAGPEVTAPNSGIHIVPFRDLGGFAIDRYPGAWAF